MPELTLTQPLQLAARGAGESASASRSAALQRPAPVPDRAAAAQILERMRRLQGAAAELLQEQAAACTCASMAEGFRAALAPAGEAAGRSSQAVVPGQPQRKQASGPTPAAAAKLAQLAQLRVAGAELAGHLA